MIPSKEYDAKMERSEQMKIKRASIYIKRASIYILLIIAFCAIVLLCACSRVVVINGIRMMDDGVIEMAIGDFSYEGKKVIIEYAGGETREIDLTEDMIPEAERLKFFKMGEQEVNVVYGGRYVTKMKINVARHVFDDIYELNGYTCVYDGQPHRVELNRDLPEGATVDYIYGNTFTNAGTYNVVAVLSKEGYASKTLSTQLIVQKANHDTSELTFDNKNVVYNGEVKTIEAENVPEGVTVRYDVYENDIRISNAVNAGVYTVVAHFENTSSNYNKIADKRATLVIGKADYDMSKVVLSDVTRTYDGQNYTPSLGATSELPSGVSVSFKCLDKDGNAVLTNANAGDYTIVASYAGNALNYNAIPDMTAKLVVQKRVVALGDDVTFDDQTVNFDNNAHSLAIAGSLPTGVSVEYENNSQTYAGEYEVVARFVASNPNERVDVEELSAYLIINPIIDIAKIDGHNITYKDFYYDKENYEMNLVGLDTDTYGITSLAFYLVSESQETKIEWGDPADALVDGETYRYAINLYYLGEGLDRSILVQAVSDFYTYRAVTFEDEAITYDGTVKTIEVQNVPEDAVAVYEYFVGDNKVDEAVNAGEYRVVATIKQKNTQRTLDELTANLTIQKYEYDMTGVTFEGAVFTYDGTQRSLVAQDVPEGVGVSYEYKQDDQVVDTESVGNAGTYTVVAHFIVDFENYVAIDDKEATLTINKATVSAELTDKTWQDDGEAYYPNFEDGYFIPYGVSYEIVTTKGGVQVEYCDGPGIYTVEAHFTIDEDNVNPQADLSATIRIYSVVLTGVVTFEDKEIGFDTMNKRIRAQNVPAGVEVTYEYFKGDEFISDDCAKYAGEYTVVAHFTPTNPGDTLDIDEMRATLTITKLTYDILRDTSVFKANHKTAIEPTDFWYNPETKRIDFKLPSTFFVVKRIYILDSDLHEIMFGPMSEGFSNDNGQTYQYIVEFDFITDDEGLRASADVQRVSGTFTYEQISKGKLLKISGFILMRNQTVTYDNAPHTIEYEEVPNKVWDRDSVTVTYEYRKWLPDASIPDEMIDEKGVSAVGAYAVIIHLTATDPEATLEMDAISAKLTIEEA